MWLRFNWLCIISNGCFSLKTLTQHNRDSVVGMLTTLRPEGSQVPTPAQEVFPLRQKSTPTIGPNQPLIRWATGALSLAIKRSGREAYHLHPSSAETHHHGTYIQEPFIYVLQQQFSKNMPQGVPPQTRNFLCNSTADGIVNWWGRRLCFLDSEAREEAITANETRCVNNFV